MNNSKELPAIVLCDSGASNANYLSSKILNRLLELDNSLRIQPPAAISTLLADGKSVANVSGRVELWISVVDFTGVFHSASLVFNVLAMEDTVDAILGLPSLCTVFKSLFLQCIDAYGEQVDTNRFTELVQQVKLLPMEFETGEYEIRDDVWLTTYDEGVAEEEQEIPSIEHIHLDSIFGKNHQDCYQEFLDNMEDMFPPEHREGASNIPVRVLKAKQYLRERGYQAFQPHKEGWGIKGVLVDIQWKGDLPADIPARPRKVPAKLEAKVNVAIDNLMKYFWVPSESTILTPLVVAPKSPDEVRICAAYNLTVNPLMARPSQYIPDAREQVLLCAGSAWFANADLLRAFHQLLLTVKSSEALSVATHRGNFRPIGIPEGVLFGSQYLQQVMMKILEGSEKFNLVLYDNLFVFGTSIEEFWDNFQWVLDKCIEYHVVLSQKKTKYSNKEIIFGMEVSNKGYRMEEARAEGIRQLAFPTNVKEARAALGLLNFVSHFCYRYAEYAAPIFDMTKATFKFEGDLSDYKRHYETLKRVCSESLLQLGFPDYTKRWITYADASGRAVCGIIVMLDDQDQQIPLAVYSKKLTEVAQRWPIIQKEAYALFFLYKKGRNMLIGKSHDCFTDHANLRQIEKSDRPVLQNITHYLQQYSIDNILHIKGSKNPADGATRVGILESVPSPSVTNPCDMSVQKDLLREFTETGYSSDEAVDRLNMLTLASSRDYEDEPGQESSIDTDLHNFLYALNEVDAEIALQQSHNSKVGHWGLAKTKERLAEFYPDHGISDNQIMKFLLGCNICQKHKANARPAVIPFDKTHHRFPEGVVKHRYIVSYDFLKLELTRQGNVGLAVFYNHFSKRCKLYAQKDNTADSLKDSMYAYYVDIGGFTYILSDQGSDIMSNVFSLMRGLLSNKDAIFIHLTSIPRRPQGHGTEPANKKIVRILRDSLNDAAFPYSEWDDPTCLKTVEYIMNFTRNSETGAIPIAVDTGSPELFFPLISDEDIEALPDSREASHVKAIAERYRIIRDIVAANHDIIHAKRTRHNGEQRNKILLPGTFVTHDDGSTRSKLALPRKGPYEVVSHTDESNEVTLRDLVTGELIPKAYSGNLTLYVGDEASAKRAAMLDHKHYEVEKILAYRGDHLKRTSCDLLVLFADAHGDESRAIWRRWAPDLDNTIAYEDFLRSRSELQLLLYNAKVQDKMLAEMKNKAINIKSGTISFVDLRSWDQNWYESLELPDHHRRRYMCKGIYGKTHKVRGKDRIDITFDLIDEQYIGNNAVAADFVTLWGSNFQLPVDATLIDEEFLLKFPNVVQYDKREYVLNKCRRHLS